MGHYVKEQINRGFLAMGIVVLPHTSYSHVHPLRRVIIERMGINLVVDAGAGQGGDVAQLRKSGYRGRAISFEPMRAPFELLAARIKNDPLWTCRNQALGSFDGPADI